MAEIPAEQYYVHGHKRYLLALGLSLILFISALDSTIVAVALPTIGSDLNDFQKTSWVVTAYLLTYTAFLPIISKLIDIVGRKPVLTISTLFFMLWSGACGGAKTMVQLIVFRALQGIGGSAIYSGVVVTISTSVPPEILPTFSSLIGATMALSSVSGPLIGGAIVQNVHWGWIFFVNLPIGAIGTVILLYALNDPDSGPKNLRTIIKRVDWSGSFLLLSFSILFAFSLQVGGTDGYPWASAKVLVPLVISFCLIPTFIYVETLHSEPILPLRLLRIRNVSLILLFSFTLGAGLYTHSIFLPQRMQIVNGLTPIKAGVRMLPLLLLIGFLSPFAAALVIHAKSYRPLMWFASSVGAVGAGLLSTITIPTYFSRVYGFEALVGLSLGVTITISTIIAQWCVERRDLAATTGFQTFIRQLGGLVAIAVSTAIINDTVNTALQANSLLANSPALLRGILESPTDALSQPGLDDALRLFVREAYSKAYSRTFVQGAAWMAAGAAVTFGLAHKMPPQLLGVQREDLESGTAVSTEKSDGEPSQSGCSE
ncbi:hypothetical protein V5O48_005969 [Marasmius crinis-equi]|uniref:Major facilitator superfamily (MFS) profile domain-containing protein n=1 Tax=Marasmius crinis-equi TaxID=585013 RepID=A0ABR3FLF0_9AGAR